MERGPLSLVSTTEELLGKESSGSGLESRDCGGRCVGTVRSRTQATEFDLPFVLYGVVTLLHSRNATGG
jgi:hypothetical protein